MMKKNTLSPQGDRWAFLHEPFTRALLALLVIVMLGILFHAEGTFFSWGTHRDMLRQVSVYGILACGMTLVIITSGIDLSVGSVMGLVSVVFAQLCLTLQWPAYLTVPISLFVGVGCGALSGLLVARYAIQPFIATLAMMVFARGMAKYVTGGMKVSPAMDETTYQFIEPPIIGFIDGRILGGNVAIVTLIFLCCVAITWVVLAKLRAGRYLYAIGGNEESARLSGVPVIRAKILAYGLCGLFSAVAGICQMAQEHQGDPEAGIAYELQAIAMVIIGGTSLMGGRGSVLLTLLGVLTIGYLEKILSINAVGEASRLMLTGLIIVGAVFLQRNKR